MYLMHDFMPYGLASRRGAYRFERICLIGCAARAVGGIAALVVFFCAGLSLVAGPQIAVAQGPTSSQAATMQGVVQDADTGQSLPLANVALVGTSRGATTDDSGAYRITDVPPGRYTVVVSYVGFETYRRTLQLEAGETRTLDIRLRAAELEARGVTVVGDRVGERDLGVERISAADVDRLPTVLEPDIFRSLQLLPGVKAASDFSSGLYIRGGSPDQTLILLDEASVYNPSHVFGFFSTFNPDAVGEVLLYKGGYPAEYGGRLGSVVDIRNRRDASSTEGGVSVGLLASRAYATGPYRRGAWMIAVRRSTLEPLLAGLNGAGVEDIPKGFYFYDINSAATFDASPRDQLMLSVYAGRDQLDYPFLEEAQFDIGYGNQAATASWQRTFSDAFVATLSGSASHYFSDPVADISGTAFIRDNDVVDLGARADVLVQPDGPHTIEGGLEIGRFTSEMTNTFDGEQNYSPSFRSTRGAVYLQDTYRPHDEWTITAGVRTSYFSESADWRVAPRLTVAHQLSDQVRLQAGYGRYYQYLSLVTTELFSAFDFWLTTDAEVPPSFGDQFVAGIKTNPVPSVQLDVEGYYRTMNDLFELDRRRQDYTGLPYASTLLFGEGYAYGVEVMLRRTEGRADGFVGYTLSRTERRFRDGTGLAVNGFEFYTPKYDRTHDLTAVLNYDLGRSWQATGVFTYATGQAYTEPTGFYKISFDWQSSFSTALVAPALNASRLPAYHRLDLGVRRIGRFFGVADYELNLQVVNAYGRRNIWFYLLEPTQDNNIRVTEVPQIPIPLPNISLTLLF